MRYQLRRKLFAFGDDFRVRDETGADRYIVDGKVFTLGHRVIIRDTHHVRMLHAQCWRVRGERPRGAPKNNVARVE